MGIFPFNSFGKPSFDQHDVRSERPAGQNDRGPSHTNRESAGAAWVRWSLLHELELHPGLAASLARLAPLLIG